MAKLSKALMTLFLDKKARKTLKNRPQQPASSAAKDSPHTLQLGPNPAPNPNPVLPTEAHPSPEAIHDRLDQAEREMERKRSPERLQLIQDALKIRNEKSKLLDELSDEQRQKLQDIALRSFLNGGND